ncbi:TfoX/Sxy family protein [Streptomyces sp. NBC_00078]|uniref:TfoX/Sxy family protein n=1 Tax=unclassified Streptomyces TaxID=2593676 RepID=UPI002254835D|nr:TfoX/Sxy family protein [Streptomyces sp. NBC_00078]MCX5424766.1 TfoX/Sxy family protein [Streptomyces sp. NBC_00078]
MQSVREVHMFGGLGFMVNGKLAVFAHGDGGMWLRCTPSRVGELERKGAQCADMGNGRNMGAGWVQVSAEQVPTEETLDFWLDVALDHHRSATTPRRKR